MLQTVETVQCDDIQEAGTPDHVQSDDVKPKRVTEEYSVEKVFEWKNEEGNYM